MAGEGKKTRGRSGVFRAVVVLIICALVAAIVEVGIFNEGWVASLFSGDAITINPFDGGQEVKNRTLTLNDVDTKVSSLRVEFLDDEWHDVTVRAMDESSSEYRNIGTIHTSGEPLYFHSTGKTLSIELSVDGVPSNVIGTITLNGATTIDFSALRWAIMALLLFALWLLRPSSPWWELRALDHRKVFPICAGIMCLIALATALVAYSYTTLDGNDLRGLNQYTDLARALASGHVYLDYEPSDALLAMSNPYDTGAREGIDYLWDYAFFDGKYYSYFGVVPCLVFYLPFYLITGGALPNIVVTMIALVAFYIGGIYLVRRIIGRWFPDASVTAVVLCAIAILFGTMSLSLVSLTTIYPVPIACGAACAIWGLALWTRACEGDGFSWRFALAGSLLGALTLGCRPQLFLVFLLILPLFIEAVRSGRVRARAFFPLIAPIVVVGIALCAYNYARFGSPLDFGSSYNLTNDDMSKHKVTIYTSLLGLFGFLLQPPHVIADWPFITGVDLSYTQNSDLVIEETFGGLLAVAPITLLSLWFCWRKRLGLSRHGVLVAQSAAGVGCAVLLACFDACAGGLILRYQVDMGLFLAVAACIGIAATTSKLLPVPAAQPGKEGTAARENLAHIAKLAFSILACLSVAISTLYFLCF